jgi:short subunit dehydrogenase-like uncharacterized protein
MFEACLETKANYLDITGEIGVFERVRTKDAELRKAGIVGLPGVGFDVVPSDCLAAMLKRELPDAISLVLAFQMGGKASQGTLKTVIEGMGAGGAIRRDGKIVRVPAAYRTRMIRFEDKDRLTVSIPWGDVATAHQSTGIPNIEVYMASSPKEVRNMRVTRALRPVLALGPVQKILKRWVDRCWKGDEDQALATGYGTLWGKVENARGEKREMRLRTPNGYRLTVNSSLECVRRVQRGDVKPGAYTPSLAFGADFVLSLPDCRII